MERIQGQVRPSRECALNVLSWITCAKRPLTTAELQHALAVEIGEPELDEDNLPEIEDMISVCAGLVTVDEESKIIRLVHYTTQEYFQRRQTFWFPNAETDITKTCITYLSFDTFETSFCPTDKEFEARLKGNVFYDYAARNWGYHACKAPLSSQMIMEFLESTSKVEASIQALMAAKRYSSHANYSQEFPRYMTGSHLAAHFGLEEAMKQLLIRGHKLNLKDSELRTPLSWAARSGHDAIIAFLSTQGIADIDSRDKSGQTLLSHAAGNGHEAAVKLLLTKDGVDPNSRDNFSRTPLSRAAMFGHVAVVELLLAQDGVDPDPEDDDSETPLVLAAMYSHDAVIKLLLDTSRVAPEFKDAKYRSWVAERGNAAVVEKLLVTDGVDPDSKDNDGRTPLSFVAAEAHTETIQSLLGYGASPTTIDIRQKGLLHYAIGNVNCKMETVKTLLMLGAPTDLVDVDKMTPLHYTVRHGRQDIAKLLIQNGVPVDIAIQRKAWTLKNHEGRMMFESRGGHLTPSVERHCTRGLTPLHYAALVGNCQMVQFFLDRGADPNAVSYYRETPLHLTLCKNIHGPEYKDDWTEDQWRAEVLLGFIDPEDDDVDETFADIARWRMAVIDGLLNHPKADVKVQDTDGASALHRAPYGKPECAIIVSRLIEKGADVSSWNSRKQCPLQLACLRGDSASVQVLLSHSADILYVDHDGLNALHYAATSRNVETISRILGASDTNCLNISALRDKRGRNALHHTLANGANIEGVQLLLDKGVDVKDRDIDGNSPLASHLINSRLYIDDDICRLLLRSGSDATAVNDQGLALAHLAANCLRMNVAVLEALMDFGADIEILDIQGRTLLHHTALEGSLTETVLTFLLDKTELRSDNKDLSGKTPLQYAAEQAGKKRHRHVFDSQRWSRSLEILMRNEAVAG
jgi:ankyrin repeat protein